MFILYLVLCVILNISFLFAESPFDNPTLTSDVRHTTFFFLDNNTDILLFISNILSKQNYEPNTKAFHILYLVIPTILQEFMFNHICVLNSEENKIISFHLLPFNM